MSRNNSISKVLVTTGNQTILAAGGTAATLALGQIGIFDAGTHLAIDSTTTTPPANVYFAVGVDKDLDTVKDDIEVSAGQYIQRRNLKFLSYRPHTPGQSQVTDIVGYKTGECDADYSIKVEVKNQEILRTQGYVSSIKTYSVRTPCCVGSQTATDGNLITNLLVAAIVADAPTEFTAVATARQTLTTGTHGTASNYAANAVMTTADVAQLAVYNAANPGTAVYSNIRITMTAMSVKNFTNVNLKYFKARQNTGLISLLEDMTCIGALVSNITTNVYEEGLGYDIQQKEYHSQINGAGPYILSEGTGTAKDIMYYATKTLQYDQFSFEYDHNSLAGWLDYTSQASTTVAIPAASTVTRNAFAVAIDVIFGGLGFDAITNDAAAGNVNPATVEKTESKGAATDGITS